MVMMLENMPAEKVAKLEIPTGDPLVYKAEKTGEGLSWRRIVLGGDRGEGKD